MVWFCLARSGREPTKLVVVEEGSDQRDLVSQLSLAVVVPEGGDVISVQQVK